MKLEPLKSGNIIIKLGILGYFCLEPLARTNDNQGYVIRIKPDFFPIITAKSMAFIDDKNILYKEMVIVGIDCLKISRRKIKTNYFQTPDSYNNTFHFICY